MIDEIETITLEFEKPLRELEIQIADLQTASQSGVADSVPALGVLEEKYRALRGEIYGSLTPWQRVQLARHPQRPYMMDYVNALFTDFVELHGDRSYGDDKSIVAGMAVIDGKPVVVIGQQKGRNLHENIGRNFAMAHPEGYRKALRVMKFAEKFNKPVITFIDTPGAYPGIAAEERGQAEAIARNLREMASLKIPVISIVIGEGGSGGALGIGIANRILMLENAYYSVISPEGCAAILFRDATRAQDAATALKITAEDLVRSGVVDEIIKEPLGGAHRDFATTTENVKQVLLKHLSALNAMSPQELEQARYAKFRNMGVYTEEAVPAPIKIKKKKTK
ncbi:MAG: acetyl-CoA carboxylase carboxyltransferase subunit alpha [Elusimicrobia bacterium]|nr:acetyl-CoA carboxylase carboxyltransferase subunit alpha [Elusimicrobiota bacterium]